MSIIFHNNGNEEISSVNITLSLFDGKVLPYRKTELRISPKHKTKGDVNLFGEDYYIDIPETYFTRYEIALNSICFKSGTVKEYGNIISSDKLSYKPSTVALANVESDEKDNSFLENFPVKVVPQFGEYSWVCCCSHKNPKTATACEVCHRSRDGEKAKFDNIEAEAEVTAKNQYSAVMRREKAEFMSKRNEAQNKAEGSDEEIFRELKKVEKREKYKDKMKLQILPRIALYFIGAYAIYLLIRYLTGNL